jgi:hypothetical protein
VHCHWSLRVIVICLCTATGALTGHCALRTPRSTHHGRHNVARTRSLAWQRPSNVWHGDGRGIHIHHTVHVNVRTHMIKPLRTDWLPRAALQMSNHKFCVYFLLAVHAQPQDFHATQPVDGPECRLTSDTACDGCIRSTLRTQIPKSFIDFPLEVLQPPS